MEFSGMKRPPGEGNHWGHWKFQACSCQIKTNRELECQSKKKKKKKLGRVVRVEWLLKSVCFFFYFTWLLSYVFEGHAQSVLLKVYTLHFHSIHTHANAGDKEILEFAAFQSGIDELRPAKFVSSKDVWLLADLKERKL